MRLVTADRSADRLLRTFSVQIAIYCNCPNNKTHSWVLKAILSSSDRMCCMHTEISESWTMWTDSRSSGNWEKGKTFSITPKDPDPENLLKISQRKQRHLNEGNLMKQIMVENVVKQLKQEVNKKYTCEFNFSIIDTLNNL